MAGRTATPRAALVALLVLFAVVLGLHGLGWVTLADLLRLAGQNFFLLYLLAVAAFIKIERRRNRRTFGIAAFVVCAGFGSVFGWGLLYAAAVFAIPYVIDGWIGRNRHHELDLKTPGPR